MSKYRVTLEGKCYEMEVERIPEQHEPDKTLSDNRQFWQSNGTGKPFVQIITPSFEQKVENDDHSVSSPISGTILKVFCKQGDLVKKGQTVVLLEAMKMENNIVASKDGFIKNIFIKEGETVAGGTVLFEIGNPEIQAEEE